MYLLDVDREDAQFFEPGEGRERGEVLERVESEPQSPQLAVAKV